jgi:hypothetical protein
MAKLDVFKEASADLDGRILEYGTFCSVWKIEYPDVKIPSQKRLGKCETCKDIHDHIESERDPLMRATWKAKQRDHNKFIKAERMVYHEWRRLCRADSRKYLCIIMDGMDQNKTNVGDLDTRIFGAIAHGAEKQVYMFLVTHYNKETNGAIECLRRVLAAQSSLPPTLILQFDNTSQENKNSRMFSFLASLVEHGIIKEIIVNFLPVGHTHGMRILLFGLCACYCLWFAEDIDQLFSLISKELKKTPARTLPELISSIKNAVRYLFMFRRNLG